MGVIRVVVPEPDFRADKARGGVGLLVIHRGEVAKGLLGKLDQLVVVDATGRGQDHPGASVVLLDEGLEVLLLDGLDVLDGAEDGLGQVATLVGSGVQVVKDNLLGLQTGEEEGLKARKKYRSKKKKTPTWLSTSSISLRMTPRSVSISWGERVEFWRMSERISTALGTSFLKVLA